MTELRPPDLILICGEDRKPVRASDLATVAVVLEGEALHIRVCDARQPPTRLVLR